MKPVSRTLSLVALVLALVISTAGPISAQPASKLEGCLLHNGQQFTADFESSGHVKGQLYIDKTVSVDCKP